MALETRTILTVDTNAAVVSLKSLRQEIKDAKEAMLNAKEGSTEYANAMQQAADKAFALREMQEKIRGTANDLGEILSNGTKVLGGIASGYAAAQGAMSLFGVENKDLEKQLLKVQSAMAIMNGLEGLEGLGKNLSNLGTQLMRFGFIQKTVTALQWAWNAAMAANPIGLMVAAIAALGAAIYGLTKYFEASEEALKKENTALDGLVFSSKEAVAAHNDHIAVMQELDEELRVSKGLITDYEKAVLDLAESYNISIAEIEKTTEEKLKKVNGFWNGVWTAIKNGGNVYAAAAEQAKESADVIIEGEQQKKDKTEELDKRITLLKQRELNKQAANAKKASDDALKRIEADGDSQAKAYNDRLEGQDEMFQDSYDKQLAQDQAFYEEQEAMAKQANGNAYDILVDRLNKEAEARQQAVADEQAATDARIAIANSYLDALNNLSDAVATIFSKSKKAQAAAIVVEKGVAIARLWIDTVVANQKFKAQTGVFGIPLAIANTVAAAASTALIVAQSAKALQALGESGGGGNSAPSTNNGGGGTVRPPRIAEQIQPTRNIMTQDEQSNKLQPIRAYVVEADISTTQKKVSTTKQEASF